MRCYENTAFYNLPMSVPSDSQLDLSTLMEYGEGVGWGVVLRCIGAKEEHAGSGAPEGYPYAAAARHTATAAKV